MQLLPMLPNSRFHLLPQRLCPDQSALFFTNLRNYMGEDGAFFVLDTDAVGEAMGAWRQALPTVRPFYPLKANSDPVLLATLAAHGAGFSAVSIPEVHAVLSLRGTSTADILYTSPLKTRGSLLKAAGTGITTLTFDSHQDLVKIKAALPGANLFLRFALPGDFGADPETEAPALLAAAAALGLSVHGLGFQAQQAGDYELGIAHAQRLLQLGRQLGHPMRTLDLGSGFSAESLPLVAPTIATAIRGLDNVDVIAQPGTFLATPAAILVANIIAKRAHFNGTDFTYYINEGVFGAFGNALLGEDIPQALPVGKDGVRTLANVYGPSADGMDQVKRGMELPEMEEGDWLMFPGMGGRAVEMAGSLCGFPAPPTFHTGTATAWALLRHHLDLQDDEDEATSDEEETDSDASLSSTESLASDLPF